MAAPLSKWAAFKLHYVRPEMYPLVGAVGTALGLSVFFLGHKAHGDPTVTWERGARSAGTGGGLGRDPSDVLSTDVRPEVMTAAELDADGGAWEGKLWAGAVRKSTGVFAKEDNAISASNRLPNPSFPSVSEARAATGHSTKQSE